MHFKLSINQIEEIIELYGVSKSLIKKIEFGLNETELIKDEEDYFLLVCEVISQYLSIGEISKNKSPYEDKVYYYMNLSEIIVQQIAFYYQNFEDDKVENKLKFYNLIESNKKRHN